MYNKVSLVQFTDIISIYRKPFINPNKTIMKRTFVSFFFLLIGINLFSQTWISFDGISQSPKEPEILLITSNNQEVSIDFNLFGTNSTIVNNNGINYQRLQIPSCINSISTGYPDEKHCFIFNCFLFPR